MHSSSLRGQQHFDRLSEVIFDYISDENYSEEKIYSEIKKEIESCLAYFNKYSNKCRNLLDLVNGLPNRGNIEPSNISKARVEAKSPYNDGWTQGLYDDIVKEWEMHKIKNNIGISTEGDWVDFWENFEVYDDC